MKINEILVEEQLDEINWRKAAATGALALGALGALGTSQARVSPQDDGKMSPSFSQQVAAKSEKLNIIKELPNDFQHISLQGRQGVRDKEDGTIFLFTDKSNYFDKIYTDKNGREVSEYVIDWKLKDTQTLAALRSIQDQSNSTQVPQETQGVKVTDNGQIQYQGKSYNIVKYNSNQGPTPRISRYDAKVLVPWADLGVRSIGNASVILVGNQALIDTK